MSSRGGSVDLPEQWSENLWRQDLTQSTKTETGMDWQKFANHLAESDGVPECIECRTNIDGTLDYTPLPLGMRNIWLFNNGGERNDVY